MENSHVQDTQLVKEPLKDRITGIVSTAGRATWTMVTSRTFWAGTLIGLAACYGGLRLLADPTEAADELPGIDGPTEE